MSETDYLPISLSTLVPDTNVGLDLYRKDEAESKYVLFLGRDFPIGPGEIERLRQRGVNELYITRRSRERFQDYLRDLATDCPEGATMSARVEAMNAVVRDVLANSFRANDTDQMVGAITELGAMAAEIVSNDQFTAGDLFRVMHHDYATFTHVANVSFYAAILAAEMGTDAADLQRLTIGGLLHDLGKLEIPDRILGKPGRLDEEEHRTIKTHPVIGFRRLAHREDLNEGQLMMVYQHHERIDGKGYPTGVVGDEIHPWAKICAVVDVYEALTSHRPYRAPMPRRQAIELMERDSGTAFDPEVLRCWSSIIQQDLPH